MVYLKGLALSQRLAAIQQTLKTLKYGRTHQSVLLQSGTFVNFPLTEGCILILNDSYPVVLN